MSQHLSGGPRLLRRLLVVVAAMLLLVPLGSSSGAAAIEGPGSQVWATRYDGPVSHADAGTRQRGGDEHDQSDGRPAVCRLGGLGPPY